MMEDALVGVVEIRLPNDFAVPIEELHHAGGAKGIDCWFQPITLQDRFQQLPEFEQGGDRSFGPVAGLDRPLTDFRPRGFRDIGA